MAPLGGVNVTCSSSLCNERLKSESCSCRFNVRDSVFSGQRGASDREDEDEHPEGTGAQVRLNAFIL